MGRFSDIRRGGELKLKLDAYVNYLQNPPARQLNSRGDRAPSSPVYFIPFGAVLSGADKVLTADANDAGYGLLSSFINASPSGDVTNALGSKEVTSIGRFRPAKVTVFQNATKIKTTPPSRFTGRPYLKYAGDTFSCPFGAQAASSEMFGAFAEIKATLRARTGLQVNRVSFIAERLYA
jgi:hypothetical protein